MKITDSGIELDSWDDVLARAVDGYKEIYGQDIDLRQNTPDGQRVGIEARMIMDAQQVAAYIYNEMDPDRASLNGLRRLGKLNGIYQEPVLPSLWDIKIDTDRSVTIRDNFTIKDDLGQKWVTDGRDLPIGSTVVTFRSVEMGAIGGGTTLERDTVVLGIIGFAPMGDPVLGRDEESAPNFRMRRKRTVALPAQSVMGGLYSGLASVKGVTDLAVYDNEQREDDPITGLPGNSVYCVVEGGEIVDIVRMVAIHKGMGTRSIGEIEDVWVEKKIKPNGGEFFMTHTMRFDRPTYVNIHVTLTATRHSTTEPVDVELIKEMVAAHSLEIGQSLQAGTLYEFTYIASARYVVTELQISRDGDNFTDGKLVPEINEKFVILPENVFVDEVIP